MDNHTMYPTLRERRMHAEWLLLTKLGEANPHIFTAVQNTGSSFHVQFAETPGWFIEKDSVVVATEYSVEYVFPRYYPTLPIEAYCARVPFHPNAHPGTGFLCLWADYTPDRSILDAVVTTRAVLAHQAMNHDAQHCMQPAAFGCEPLSLPMLDIPESCRATIHGLPQQRRSRLSSAEDEPKNLQVSFAISDSE